MAGGEGVEMLGSHRPGAAAGVTSQGRRVGHMFRLVLIHAEGELDEATESWVCCGIWTVPYPGVPCSAVGTLLARP